MPGLVGGGCRSLQSEPSDLTLLDWLCCPGPGHSVDGIKDEVIRLRTDEGAATSFCIFVYERYRLVAEKPA